MVWDLILQALSSPFSIAILYLLHKYEEMKLSEILAKIGFSKYKSVRNTIMALSKAGLITVAISKISPRVKAWRIKLTERGRRLIEALISALRDDDSRVF